MASLMLLLGAKKKYRVSDELERNRFEIFYATLGSRDVKFIAENGMQ